MSKTHRTSRSKQQESHDEQTNDTSEQSPDAKLTMSQIIKSRMTPIVKGIPKTEADKDAFFINLIRLREDRYTIAQCALAFDVSERTINHYMDEPRYKEIHAELISDHKEMGHLMISEVIPEAITTLFTLMQNDKSGFVRMKSAETLLNFAGYNTPRDEAKSDSREGLLAFMKIVEARNAQPSIMNVQHMQVIQEGNSTTASDILSSAGQVVESEPAIPANLAQYYRQVLPGGKLPPEEP